MAQSTVQPGVVDLRNYNFSEGTLPLDGDWAFYPHSFLSLYELNNSGETPQYYPLTERWSNITGFPQQDNYTFGTGTYYLKIIAPEKTPSLALKVNEINTAHRLLLNGVLEGSVGTIGKTESSSEPRWNEYVAPIDLKPGVNHLVLQVSNYQHYAGGKIYRYDRIYFSRAAYW